MPLFHFTEPGLFRSDSLSWIMAGLIVFVIANVTAYSSRYLAGDRNQRSYYRCVMLLGACVLVMVFADHLLLLLVAYAASNLLLVRLMIHKVRWIAARNAGLLALKTFGVGFMLVSVGFWLLAENAGTASIQGINSRTDTPTTTTLVGLLLVGIAAMIQSAAWPFHRWLTSSLNSPTPVSALMHAGLVNGGGYLLVRFAPLYANQTILLHGLFVAGLITAVVGTFWKLLQPDIKRMLACSTMGQMGFMLMQCGMGLFVPAVSHLCWHGLFKAYQFLGTGSVVQEKRSSASACDLSPVWFLIAGLAGVCGALGFVLVSGIDFRLADTGCEMVGLAFIAAAQIAVGLLEKPRTIVRILGISLVGLGAGVLYGLSVRLVEVALASLHVTQPQPMDAIYSAGFAVILLGWIAMILNLPVRLQSLTAWKRLYVTALNASQPHPQTVTANRTAYQS
jgi:NAD(P)H-quinone oxidoreductase subunit 5